MILGLLGKNSPFQWRFSSRAKTRPFTQSSVNLQCRNSLTDTITSLQTEVSFFSSLLRRSIHFKSLVEGKRAHYHIIKIGLDQNVTLSNLLLQMYGSCGALQDAILYFSHMRQRDACSWKTVIKSCSKYGSIEQTFGVFTQMHQQGFAPDDSVLASIISTCSGRDNLPLLMLTHTLITDSLLRESVYVTTALLTMYGKNGCLEDAVSVFEQASERDVVCWNAMIAAYVAKEENMRAINVFKRMNVAGVKPEHSTYLSVLSACADMKVLSEGYLVHLICLDGGLERDVGVANALVNMYGHCDSLEDGNAVFKEIPVTDVVSWNVMISGFLRRGRNSDAISLFQQMQQKGVEPSNVTFVSVICACSNDTQLEQGQNIHHFIVWNGADSDIVIQNSLITMYGNCRCLKDAKKVFDKCLNWDRVSWTAILSTFVQCGCFEEAISIFYRLHQEGVIPDRVTYVSVSMALNNNNLLSRVRQIHVCILICGFSEDLSIGNSLVTMYGKCGSAKAAKTAFEKMVKRDLLSWNGIISAYVQNDMSDEALKLLKRMAKDSIYPDKFLCSSIMCACASSGAEERGREMHAYAVINGYDLEITVANAVVNMYGKFGDLEDALKVFDKMTKRDIVSWSAVIAAHAQRGQGKYAVQLYNKMINEGVISDKIALVHLLSACSHEGLVDEALYHFAKAADENPEVLIIDHFNCMVDLLGRMGRLEEAEKLLVKLPFKSSAVAWTTLLGACKSQMDVVRGEQAAKRIFVLNPEDAAPYITLSNLYFSAGRMEDALHVIKMMRDKGLKKPENLTIQVFEETDGFVDPNLCCGSESNLCEK